MNLADVATTRVIAVPADESIDRAIAIMEEHEVHHLPVVSQGNVVGMLSDRDILTAVGGLTSAQRRLPGGRVAGPQKVADLMSKPVHTLAPGDTIRLATRLMVHERIHAIPLVRAGELVGIVTGVDLLAGIFRAPEFTETKQPLFSRPIRSFVTGRLTTAGPRTSLDELVDLMLRDRIRHLPIVVASELLGIISDRDVRAALGRSVILDEQAQESGKFFLGSSLAMEIMHTNVMTIDADATLGQAVDALLSNRVHCLPALHAGQLVAIITDTDILRAIGDADKI
jgi:acetoin utilization protein AcuB